eukprot:scaffold18148_cov55-Phaeocystis_antarctica.AAC.1
MYGLRAGLRVPASCAYHPRACCVRTVRTVHRGTTQAPSLTRETSSARSPRWRAVSLRSDRLALYSILCTRLNYILQLHGENAHCPTLTPFAHSFWFHTVRLYFNFDGFPIQYSALAEGYAYVQLRLQRGANLGSAQMASRSKSSSSEQGSSKSVSFADAAGSLSSLTSMEGAPTPPYSLKRRASSTFSALLRRLSQGWNSADEEDNEAEEPVTPRSFSMRLRKVMRIIGLSNSNSDDQPQLPAEPGLAPAQPSPAVASLGQCSGISVDDLSPSELSLDEL